MPNVPQYVIGALAVLKLGAMATGVSPLLATAEVASQLEDAGVKVLIALDSLAKPTLEALDGQGKLPVCVRAVIVTGANDLTQPVRLELPELAAMSCLTYPSLLAMRARSSLRLNCPLITFA